MLNDFINRRKTKDVASLDAYLEKISHENSAFLALAAKHYATL